MRPQLFSGIKQKRNRAVEQRAHKQNIPLSGTQSITCRVRVIICSNHLFGINTTGSRLSKLTESFVLHSSNTQHDRSKVCVPPGNTVFPLREDNMYSRHLTVSLKNLHSSARSASSELISLLQCIAHAVIVSRSKITSCGGKKINELIKQCYRGTLEQMTG